MKSTSYRRRAYGQHFLTNPRITDKIVRLAGVEAKDTVLEIGPGKGILTDSLLKAGAQVIAVEKDRRLAAFLNEKYADESKIEIHTADFLKFNLSQITAAATASRLKVVANLPYSVATEIIFKLLASREMFSSLTVMVQKEVADRLVGVPGNKQYGVLTVLTQLYSISKIVLKVPPGAFNPPPKVDSAVVQMNLSDQPRVAITDEAAFKKLVKKAFSTRRKMLRNALQIKADLKWQEICAELSTDPKARAETLSLEQFAQLGKLLESL